MGRNLVLARDCREGRGRLTVARLGRRRDAEWVYSSLPQAYDDGLDAPIDLSRPWTCYSRRLRSIRRRSTSNGRE